MKNRDEYYKKASKLLQKHVPNRYSHRNSWVDAMIEFAELYNREVNGDYTSREPALNLDGVSNNEVALKAFVEEFVESWEDGNAGDTDLYRKAKRLL